MATKAELWAADRRVLEERAPVFHAEEAGNKGDGEKLVAFVDEHGRFTLAAQIPLDAIDALRLARWIDEHFTDEERRG